MHLTRKHDFNEGQEVIAEHSLHKRAHQYGRHLKRAGFPFYFAKEYDRKFETYDLLVPAMQRYLIEVYLRRV